MNRPVSLQEISARTLSAEWKALRDFKEQEIREWRDLASRALDPNVFLEPGFALAAARMCRGNISAVLVREGPRLIGLFPGEVEGIASGRAVNTFVLWTHPFAPLSTPLVDSKLALAASEKFIEFLPSIPGGPKLFLLPFVNENGPFARAMGELLLREKGILRRFNAHRRAAFSPATGDALSLPGKKLKELQRQRRRLEETGALVHETVSDPLKVGNALLEYLVLEAKGWKGRGGSAAQSDPATEQFIRAAVSALGAQEKVRMDFLRLNGAAIAAAITLFSGGNAWFWKISYDETHARYSPGVQLSLELTEAISKDKNIRLVDSCATAGHPMIDHLWERRIRIADWLVPLSGKASFAAGVVFETARRFSIHTLKAARGLVR